MQIRTLEKSPGRFFFLFFFLTSRPVYLYTYAIGYICITYSLAHTLSISDSQGEIIFNNAVMGLVAGAYFAFSNRNIYVIVSSFPVVSTPELQYIIAPPVPPEVWATGSNTFCYLSLTVGFNFFTLTIVKLRVLKRRLTLDFQTCSCGTTWITYSTSRITGNPLDFHGLVCLLTIVNDTKVTTIVLVFGSWFVSN